MSQAAPANEHESRLTGPRSTAGRAARGWLGELGVFRWLGLGWLVVGMPLTVVALLTVAGPAWTASYPRSMGLILGGVVLGGIPGAALWGLASRHESDLARLRRFLEQFDPDASQLTLPRGRFELAPINEALANALSGLRRQLQQAKSERRELDVSLRVCEAERRHLTAVLNAISDAVIVTDAFNEVALANEAAARVTGFDLDHVQRQPIDQAVGDQQLVQMIKNTREGGDPSLRRHVEHEIEQNGKTYVYDVTLACVPSGGGHGATGTGETNGCAGIVTVLRDITREKEIAEMKSNFVSNVSHELRTPLSSIKAYMEMLVDGEAEDEQTRQQFYNTIQSETTRLSRLVDNILNINRIETGVVKLHREYVSLKELMVEAADIMEPQARAKQIELVKDKTPVCCQVWGDRDMLTQAVLNLVGNAIKYTPEGGRVTLSMEVDEHAGSVSVSVSDTGRGISPEDLPHLFDKFYRVQDHKKMAKGSGLGLNLVKHVIETVHEGRVYVTSEIDRGSTFTFTLPMADNE